MPVEIERKFLVANDGWRDAADDGLPYRQGYLATTRHMSARVRIVGGRHAMLTVKAAQAGLARAEFEYEIPVRDAVELLRLCEGAIIDKRRHLRSAGALEWEIDVFEGALAGLVVAEIELPSADAEFERPDWLGREITGDPRYYNASLAADGLPEP